MNNLPIQTYESVVQQRDALEKRLADVVAESNAIKDAAKSLLSEASIVYSKYNETQQPDKDLVDMQTLHELQVAMSENPATEAFTRERMARGVDALQIPESFKTISDNIRTQDNRATSHPLFAVMQKREIVTSEDHDYTRIVWVDCYSGDYDEADETKARRLEILYQNGRSVDGWDRYAVLEINVFVTACFTEKGCQDYIDCEGHNLNKPFIYVFSAYRNAEFIAVREWLAKGINDAQ
ncbi:ead/Ea22-like family protein [Hafnia paralvei]|uniref:ead/Ea22-like family protein n=1 Tax=Hafnia paralvei TaxID=546367 RepID=UPI0029D56175|nr:ead/Ea22-like family protein [Hafnia paralvei]MDX6839796.1 ead/Ea22-like family protein [Hafnia paralvei]